MQKNWNGSYSPARALFMDQKLNFLLKIALEEYGSAEQFRWIFQCQIAWVLLTSVKMVTGIRP